MRTHYKPLLVAMSLLLGAGLAFGQNADNKSAGPTKNDFRLRVLEPVEGGTVFGTTVRVSVSNEVPQPTQEARGTANMPNPSFRIYLGNTLKGELKRDENVMTIDNVPAGSQKLVIEAMNSSGEIVDRKEINFKTVPASSATASSSAPATELKPVAPATELKPVPASASASAPKASAPPAREVVSAPAPTVDMAALPHTASSAPRAAVAGMALLLAGLLVSRKTMI